MIINFYFGFSSWDHSAPQQLCYSLFGHQISYPESDVPLRLGHRKFPLVKMLPRFNWR